MATRVLSLAGVVVKIVNPVWGQLTIGGGNQQIGSVGYSFDEDMYTMTTTADGGSAVSHNRSKAGKITVQMQQTSPSVSELSEFYKKCWDRPGQTESTITITDTTGNIKAEASGVFPAKYPDNTVTSTIGNRTFEFVCAEIIPGK